MRRLPLAIALLLIAPLACAQVYKWTDAHGTVHYSQTPPANGTKYSRVAVTGSAEPLSQPEASASTETAPEQDRAPAASSIPMADTPANRAKLCASLKSNLAMLRGSGPVVMNAGGKQLLMNAKLRQEQIAKSEAQYQQYCAD